MRKLLILLWMLPFVAQAQTLEECQRAAERNYPLIRQYDLIGKTTDLTVANIEKGWLPQVSATAQATYQSDVTSWPDQMKTMLNQMGAEVKGLRKDQYRIGVDINQPIYDGGVIKSQKEIARHQGEVQVAQNEVTLYAVRQRVNEMYFSLLLLDEQMKLNQDLQELLASNEKKLSSMYKRGTASESDFNSVRAERLGVVQQMTNLQSQRQTLILMLSTFCGMEVKEAIKPVQSVVALPQQTGQRPELRLIDTQLRLADAQEKMLDAQLLPKFSVFASGFYGYPGYNMFEDMMSRTWSLNGMVGARLTWNIGSLYTRKNDKAKIQIQRELAESNREVFLFNNRLEQLQQNESIERYRKLMEEDNEIINLRSKVRKAAESKLAHGIIDVNDLVREINNENAAKIQLSTHEVQMLKHVYDLKYVTNE
ncbi:MAG: TolC family protein [Prevotella sp.]|nr:TolC family protein [Prevotella sp.]